MLEEHKAYIENKKKDAWKDFFFSANTSIRIESIRYLEHKISLSPNEGNFKVYIIEDAHEMTIQAANAFLKTLEEPPSDTVIILTTSKPNSLLPTILSRCQQIPFRSIPKRIIETKLSENPNLDDVEAKMYARIANGSLEKALRLADEGRIQSREKTLELIKMVLARDDLKFMEFAAAYRTSKSSNILSEIISHLIIWITDISYFQNYPDEIINLDKPDLLEALYELNPNIDDYATDFIEYLEKMQKKIEGHVNPELIIINIYNKLCDLFHK